ncbi:MAG: VOC family protein [Deltaproteobacteria bacterium]|nr:VOC family protein [Deltaproteobacteria bacterium]MBW2383542.1 VOC family protein [Deltaproteobacteria bacterium]MBW2698484.1 VOC family protein [Deltaproteobacteria bacterium]
MADDATIQSRSLHHVAYATRDPEATYAFYTGKLGLPLVHTENHKQADGWVNHIAFRLDSEQELDAKRQQLGERGVEHLHEIDHGWCRSIYMVDPNGIMVEFCVTTDAAAFAQTEEEALRLLRQPPQDFSEETRKERDIA